MKKSEPVIKCKQCGTPIKRWREVGRPPNICADCKAENHRTYMRHYMREKHREERGR